MRHWLAIGVMLAVAATAATAQVAPRDSVVTARYYARRDFGSEAQFNPLTQIVNEGYDILRTRFEDRHVFSRDYATGVRNVARSLWHFDRTYRFYGVANAARNEWLPVTTPRSAGGGAWVPNYEYHLLGAGMISVRMEEWFEQHDMPHPALLSAATLMASHVLNEVVENGAQRSLNEDAVTDLMIFDPAGLLLWRLDAVQRFFSGPVQMTNWPGQPSIDVVHHTLENAGQQYILRAPIPFVRDWSVFYDFGMSTLLGLSRRGAQGSAWSGGLGLDAVDNPVVDDRTGAKTATLAFKGGLFYDRDGSLLFSILAGSRRGVARLTINFYPGMLNVAGTHPGFWFQIPDHGAARFGIATRLGIGLGG